MNPLEILRLAKGNLSTRKFAAETGLNDSLVRLMLQGRRSVTPRTLAAIAAHRPDLHDLCVTAIMQPTGR